jgi:prepilin-type N-terminal cleavage/methylation domain-containing protein
MDHYERKRETMNTITMFRNRKSERGFSLIELGIVIAVIAILATVVLMGRGFLESSRVSKVVEAIDTMGKGIAVFAGANGATLPAGNLQPQLSARALIHANLNNPNYISGFQINNATGQCAAGPVPPPNQTWSTNVTCVTTQSCQDLCTAKRGDGSLLTINGAAAAGYGCPALAAMNFCFQL